ncbi:MAG: succinylglutamate desuccinylase/aspartoacylase family protein [Mesorhizobium sp.]
MHKTIERIEGDTAGTSYELAVYRFDGSDKSAPRTYIQAALHGDEFPGVAAIDALMPMLRQADGEGRILGDITVVPWANPIGRGQYVYGAQQGRFHLGTRTNFNRDFPLVDRPDPDLLGERADTADGELKQLLLRLSFGHEILLDLHCDDESALYLYVPKELWPAMSDCAAAMNVEAVVLWDGPSGSSFDEASVTPYLRAGMDLSRVVVMTAEYRGQADVDAETAQHDAAGLYRLLVARGAIADTSLPPIGPYEGIAAPIENVEMVPAPCAGMILYDVAPGERLSAGQRIARIVHTPGEENGSVEVFAPQSGFLLTRLSGRSARRGDDIAKIVGDARSTDARSGVLEA